ncbi:hypothetical protein GCM10025783_30310 [Amnibacterium soli]|uniref:PASTA domain-containing protein n=1 Tax=Amnibacterium soli TaxID=1282736 RepID=A0ABP8ZFP9_9MICO
MNVPEALRRADPARTLAAQQIDPAAEHLLQQILGTPVESERKDTAPSRHSGHRSRDWKPVLATALVAAAVVTTTILAIRAVPQPTGTGPAGSLNTGTSLEDAVFSRLATVADGVVPVRQKSALTWTEKSPSASGGAIRTSGRNLFIAAACEGGGSIAIRVSDQPDLTLDCSSPSTLGPINLTALLDAQKQAADLRIVTTSGHPKYVVKSMAFASPARTQTTLPTPGQVLATISSTDGRKQTRTITPNGVPLEILYRCTGDGQIAVVIPRGPALNSMRCDGPMTASSPTGVPGSVPVTVSATGSAKWTVTVRVPSSN